jgi:hypothetical protein
MTPTGYIGQARVMAKERKQYENATPGFLFVGRYAEISVFSAVLKRNKSLGPLG